MAEFLYKRSEWFEYIAAKHWPAPVMEMFGGYSPSAPSVPTPMPWVQSLVEFLTF